MRASSATAVLAVAGWSGRRGRMIVMTLQACPQLAQGIDEEARAPLLAKIAGAGPTNDQQTLPLLAKKPWLSMVVESGGKSGLIGRRSTVREAHEQRQIRALAPSFKTAPNT